MKIYILGENLLIKSLMCRIYIVKNKKTYYEK